MSVLTLSVAAGGASPPPPPPPPNPAFASRLFRRSVAARIYQVNPGTTTYAWTIPGKPVATVGQLLANLRPGNVGSLVRVENGLESLPANVIADYSTVRNAVKAVRPDAIFDLVIRLNRYTDPTVLTNALNTVIATGIQFEAFKFYGYGQATQLLQQTAYSVTKGAGKLVGAQLGAGQTDLLPYTIYSTPDYFEVNDIQFQLPPGLPSIIKLQVPTIMVISNGAEPVFLPGNITEHDYYVNNLTAGQRQNITTSLAALQQPNGFVWEYPVFHPEAPIGVYFDTTRDGVSPSTYDVIASTMDSMNPLF